LHRQSHRRFEVIARPIRRHLHPHFVTPLPWVLALRPAIMPNDPALAASPPLRHILEVDRSGYSSFRISSLWTDNLPAKRRLPRASPSDTSTGRSSQVRQHDIEHAGDTRRFSRRAR
jgi:hypothetical protein